MTEEPELPDSTYADLSSMTLTIAKEQYVGRPLTVPDQITPELRFIIRHNSPGPQRILQQAWRTATGIEWRNVPLVVE